MDNKIENKKNRHFGIIFGILFLFFSIWAFSSNNNIKYLLIFLSISFFILAILAPNKLNNLKNLWLKFGKILGKIISPIIISLIYFISVLPTGIIMKILQKDLLKFKIDKSKKSYWNDRKDEIGPMKNQF